VIAAYWGPVEDGERVLAPLRQFAAPAVALLQPMPYVELQALTDAGNPPGRRNYWRSDLLPAFPDEAIDALLACAATATSPASVLVMGPLGGAVSDVPEDATALGGRSAGWLYHCYGTWTEPGEDDRHIAWVRATEAAMQPWTMAGMALNFVSDIDDDRVRATFGAEKYRRLQALKDAYDSDNVFSLNQNVQPSTSSGGGSRWAAADQPSR
jgi:hypothetical protein